MLSIFLLIKGLSNLSVITALLAIGAALLVRNLYRARKFYSRQWIYIEYLKLSKLYHDRHKQMGNSMDDVVKTEAEFATFGDNSVGPAVAEKSTVAVSTKGTPNLDKETALKIELFDREAMDIEKKPALRWLLRFVNNQRWPFVSGNLGFVGPLFYLLGDGDRSYYSMWSTRECGHPFTGPTSHGFMHVGQDMNYTYMVRDADQNHYDVHVVLGDYILNPNGSPDIDSWVVKIEMTGGNATQIVPSYFDDYRAYVYELNDTIWAGMPEHVNHEAHMIVRAYYDANGTMPNDEESYVLPIIVRR